MDVKHEILKTLSDGSILRGKEIAKKIGVTSLAGYTSKLSREGLMSKTIKNFDNYYYLTEEQLNNFEESYKRKERDGIIIHYVRCLSESSSERFKDVSVSLPKPPFELRF